MEHTTACNCGRARERRRHSSCMCRGTRFAMGLATTLSTFDRPSRRRHKPLVAASRATSNSHARCTTPCSVRQGTGPSSCHDRSNLPVVVLPLCSSLPPVCLALTSNRALQPAVVGTPLMSDSAAATDIISCAVDRTRGRMTNNGTSNGGATQRDASASCRVSCTPACSAAAMACAPVNCFSPIRGCTSAGLCSS